jgi:hypothetical protein
LQKRGLTTIVLASDTFSGLVKMQAKARKVEPRLAVFKHPLSGISPAQLEERIEAAWTGLRTEMEKDGVPK